MGNKQSNDAAKRIHWAMPSWTIDNYQVNANTIKLVSDSWAFVMSGQAPPYLLAKERDPSITPLVYYYNNFYFYLFELIPECKHLFKRGIQAQGKMLANVIRFIVHNLSENSHSAFVASLTHLAKVHNQIGVTAEWFSAMGLVLIHAIRLCTGPEYFTEEIRYAWVQVYSKMMAVIIPVVVSGALPDEKDLIGKTGGDRVYNYKEGVDSDNSDKGVKTKNSSQTSPGGTKVHVQENRRSSGTPGLEGNNDTPGRRESGGNKESTHYQHVHQEFSQTLNLQSRNPQHRNGQVEKLLSPSGRASTPNLDDSVSNSPEPLAVQQEGMANHLNSPPSDTTKASESSGCPYANRAKSDSLNSNHDSTNMPVHAGFIKPMMMNDNGSSHHHKGSGHLVCPYSGVSILASTGEINQSTTPVESLHNQQVHHTDMPIAHTHKYKRLEKALIIAEAMESELNICDRVFGFRKFERCFIGAEAVEWMIANKYTSDISDSVAIGNILTRARIIANVDNSVQFSNDLSYYQLLPNKLYSGNRGSGEFNNNGGNVSIIGGGNTAGNPHHASSHSQTSAGGNTLNDEIKRPTTGAAGDPGKSKMNPVNYAGLVLPVPTLPNQHSHHKETVLKDKKPQEPIEQLPGALVK